MSDPLTEPDAIEMALEAHEPDGYACTCGAGPFDTRWQWRAHLAAEIRKRIPSEQVGWLVPTTTRRSARTVSDDRSRDPFLRDFDVPVFRVPAGEET